MISMPTPVCPAIPGMRNERQTELDCGVSDQAPMSDALEAKLRDPAWRRADWYKGKV